MGCVIKISVIKIFGNVGREDHTNEKDGRIAFGSCHMYATFKNKKR